jgi:small GTP-binding protein
MTRLIQKKVCLLGDFAVGKTSLIKRYIEGRFDEKYLTTVGVVVSRKTVAYPEFDLNLILWDLAGGQDFKTSGYLLGVAGALLVCDLTRSSTLEAYRTCAASVWRVNPAAKLVLLANKSDLAEERVISDEELAAMARELQCNLFVTSAKTGEQVEAAFMMLADSLLAQAH